MSGRRITSLKEEKYFNKIIEISRKREAIAFTKNSPFNHTEIRLIGEITLEERKGKKLISTELAKRLGVTRSAISQIVNKLEGKGVVKRVADEVDRKIAYIELTDETKKAYANEREKWREKVSAIVQEFGEENIDKLLQQMNEFIDIAMRICK